VCFRVAAVAPINMQTQIKIIDRVTFVLSMPFPSVSRHAAPELAFSMRQAGGKGLSNKSPRPEDGIPNRPACDFFLFRPPLRSSRLFVLILGTGSPL
jgi:hypothetical protein